MNNAHEPILLLSSLRSPRSPPSISLALFLRPSHSLRSTSLSTVMRSRVPSKPASLVLRCSSSNSEDSRSICSALVFSFSCGGGAMIGDGDGEGMSGDGVRAAIFASYAPHSARPASCRRSSSSSNAAR